MFDAFVRFAYGIISHEASNQGGGRGGQPGYRARPPAPESPEEEDMPADWRLDADSLRISRDCRVQRQAPPETPDPGPSPRLDPGST